MTYKGVYRDGIVTLQGDVDLRNGAAVDVNLRSVPKKSRRKTLSAKASAKRKATSNVAALFRANGWELLPQSKMTKEQRIAAALAVQGTWSDRPDWKGKSTVQIAKELRERASRRGRGRDA
ncbi:MAG: hypothetical protein AABZ53_17085 [Planctomycetota bacterium]